MDIGVDNFDEILPVILQDIKNCSFISIDLEFTGLLSDSSFRRSLLDSATSLYEKEAKNLENISVCQIGLSIFKGLKDINSYYVSTYNIYIRPRELLSVDDRILWQTSSLDFLRMCNFNYNKWLCEGVPCLREDQESEVRKLFSQFLSDDFNGFMFPKEVIQKLKEVKKWAQESEVGSKREVELHNSSWVLLFFVKLISTELNVKASYIKDTKVSLTLVESFEEENLKEEALRTLEVVVDQSKGFVKIFNELGKAKVPIIFHNGLLDLLLIYKQFYKSLPKTFSVFCRDIHEKFPLVYDTKQLAFKLGVKVKENRFGNENRNLDEEKFLIDTSLMGVKKDLDKHKSTLFRPQIIHSSDTPKYSDGTEYLHEAGYDSFITGYCFLHLSHIYEMLQYESAKFHRPLSPRELTLSMKEWSNEIPIQRAGVNYVTLDGRPVKMKTNSWYVVETRNPFRRITPEIVASSLNLFGSLDIVQRNKRSVILIAHRRSVMNDILRVLRDDNNFSVTKYNSVRHSMVVRSLAWSCALLSTGISTWCLVKGYKIAAC
ncbi:UNVERIFIED_CONTAM: hypothetical protein RMT77_006895 [Armadillidium vulgare]